MWNMISVCVVILWCTAFVILFRALLLWFHSDNRDNFQSNVKASFTAAAFCDGEKVAHFKEGNISFEKRDKLFPLAAVKKTCQEVADNINIINRVESNHELVINCKICLIFNYSATLQPCLNSVHVSFHNPTIGKFNFADNVPRYFNVSGAKALSNFVKGIRRSTWQCQGEAGGSELQAKKKGNKGNETSNRWTIYL